jgi:uncharacterized membrane protein
MQFPWYDHPLHDVKQVVATSTSRSFYDRFDQPLAIHLACVLTAVPLGIWQLAKPKGGDMHRTVGRSYVAVMSLAAGSSFYLRDIMDPAYKERFYSREETSDESKAMRALNHAVGDLFTLQGLGPVHLLSAGILVSLPVGILAARRGDITRHAFIMRCNVLGLAAVRSSAPVFNFL